MALLIAKAEACAIGDPWDSATSFGPLISAAQRDKVLKYIESGKEEGAKVATGGKKWDQVRLPGRLTWLRSSRLSSQSKGFYVTPTILTECKPHMKVVQEEVNCVRYASVEAS